MAVQVSFIGLNCRDCSDQEKKYRGCTKESTAGFMIFDNEEMRRCPVKLITPQSSAYLHAYSLYEKNFLPNGNAWLYESEKYLSAMRIIQGEIITLREEKTKKDMNRGRNNRNRSKQS